ncbi:RICIN domain-containing protein [Actinoplanes sp. L3-i22]|uniref:RICIN domain-containing protein n=1 Tax=Actinoplanes sp. L3-i22 TaxID=2836373 RepID=UPI001C76BC23|nr:RICIN domain-containing protein [Actinoplanes sp. L3-i22]BCY09003.1 hypothetical protein L3i22_040910 [Actinoplanes sp. L3-i22]
MRIVAVLALVAGIATIATPAQAATAGPFQIYNKAYGQCVDVPGGSTADSVQLRIWPCNGTDAQKWWLEDIGLGATRFRNVHSNKCIDVRGNSQSPFAVVQQYTCNSTFAQQWSVGVVLGNDGRLWRDPQHYAVNQCLDTVGGATSSLMQYTCQGNDPQLWMFQVP